MRATDTLERNIQMCYLADTGTSVSDLAETWSVRPSSVRSSLMRVRRHIQRFVAKFPDELTGDDPRKTAYRAFAEHVGVKFETKERRGRSAQNELF